MNNTNEPGSAFRDITIRLVHPVGVRPQGEGEGRRADHQPTRAGGGAHGLRALALAEREQEPGAPGQRSQGQRQGLLPRGGQGFERGWGLYGAGGGRGAVCGEDAKRAEPAGVRLPPHPGGGRGGGGLGAGPRAGGVRERVGAARQRAVGGGGAGRAARHRGDEPRHQRARVHGAGAHPRARVAARAPAPPGTLFVFQLFRTIPAGVQEYCAFTALHRFIDPVSAFVVFKCDSD
eukprot:1189771-Prorocentrum_minimum.AAC.2